jgi:hypothetical protein
LLGTREIRIVAHESRETDRIDLADDVRAGRDRENALELKAECA